MTTQSVERKDASDGTAVDSEADRTSTTDEPGPVSEKADTSDSVAAATAKSRGVFTPNQEWLDSVKGELPLNTIMRLIKYLGPQLEEISASESAVDEQKVVDFIQVLKIIIFHVRFFLYGLKHFSPAIFLFSLLLAHNACWFASCTTSNCYQEIPAESIHVVVVSIFYFRSLYISM